MQILLAELRRELRIRWSYRLNTIGWLLLWLILIPLILAIFDEVTGCYTAEQRLQTVVGFLIWFWLVMGVLVDITSTVSQEAKQGVWEAVLLVPVSPLELLSARVVVVLFLYGLETTLLGHSLAFFLHLPVHLTLSACLVLLLTALAFFGLSLLLAGLTLLVKQLGSIIGLLGLASLLLSGGLVPFHNSANWFIWLRWLLPPTWSIDALRAALIHGAGWRTLWQDGTWLGLSAQAGILLVGGVFLFRFYFHHVQKQGTLGSA